MRGFSRKVDNIQAKYEKYKKEYILQARQFYMERDPEGIAYAADLRNLGRQIKNYENALKKLKKKSYRAKTEEERTFRKSIREEINALKKDQKKLKNKIKELLPEQQALEVKMYDRRGLMTFKTFEAMYQAEYNEALNMVESKEKSKVGNIIRSMVSQQRYAVSAKQAEKIPKFYKVAEEKEKELARLRYEDDEEAYNEEIQEITERYKAYRESDWRYEGVDFTVLGKRNEELKAQGITSGTERAKIISKEFFYIEED